MQTPVMMLHGMCCTGEVWDGFRKFFEARGARVHTPTLRPDVRVRIGQPAVPGLREVGFADYVDEVASEAARIEAGTGRKPTVIGHSMGGLLAQALAERGSVSAAVFISPSAPADVRDLATRLFWLGVSFANAIKLVPFALKPERRMVDRVVFNRVPEDERAAAHEAMVYESGRAFVDSGAWPIDSAKVKVPVLTVAATQDRLVPAKLVRLTGKKYAAIGGEFREYAEHGHWLYAEPGWEKAAADIFAWLLDKESARASSIPASAAATGDAAAYARA